MTLSLMVAIPVRAAFIHTVTSNQGLVPAAEKIQKAIDSGTHVVQFSAYGNVGQFKLQSPPTKVDTLIFERNPRLESDSALRISGDSALFEIKNMSRGTVVFRGLAFHLASPGARLLAGAELGMENLHLIIDSCFIFGDNNASSFLTWQGAPGSKVEIRRSFFVFRTGNALQSKAILTGGSMVVANNLFHFGGLVAATLLPGGLFEFRSNTVHRTQLKSTSEAFQGARFEVTRNFIGHRPGQDAFGQTDPYFFWASSFHPMDSYARMNVMLQGWTGFDHPGTAPRLFADDKTNLTRDTITVKPVTELWDWYGPNAAMDSTGHAFGRDRRLENYNIFPGTSSSIFQFEGNPGGVHFKPALFPRQFSPTRTPMPVPVGFDSVRFHTPNLGAIRFGSFRVDSIFFSMATIYGRAQLFSSDSTFQFRPQRILSASPSKPHVFANELPEARHFFIGFKGNTPKGTQVSPDRSSSLGTGDTLAFGTVDSSGFTEVYEEALQAYPDSLRSLSRNFAFRTTAAVSGNMVFGSTEGVKPFWSDQVYWWRPRDALLYQASSADNGKFVMIGAAAQTFSAYLVEKLSVKRGGTTLFPLARGGQVRATSTAGYQLQVDSLYLPDSLRFGQASRGYSLKWSGRQAGDPLFLKLPGGQDTEVFRVAGDSIPSVPSTVDSLGFHTVPIAIGDSNVRIFSGIRYNVIAGRTFDDTLAGVRISGLLSTTSGRIGIHPFQEDLLSRGIGTQDTLPSQVRLLGAKGIRTQFLSVDGPWSAAFPVKKAGDSTRVVAYAWDGLKWRSLPPPVFSTGEATLPTVFGLAGVDQAIAVFELMRPATEYVETVPVYGNRTLAMTVKRLNDPEGLFKEFSLRILHVNEAGEVKRISLGPVAVGATLRQDFTNLNGLFQYAVVYHTTAGDYLPAYVPITEFGWRTDLLSVGGKPEKAGQQWHLLGSPYYGSLKRTLSKGEPVDPQADDTTDVIKLKSVGGVAAWDPVPQGETMDLHPGDGFLFNSSHVQNHRADDSARFEMATEHVLGPHTGWRFVSPPYPIDFLASAVVSNQSQVNRFLELRVDNLTGRRREYAWQRVDRLKAFTGYAYPFVEGETLTFNPWQALTPAPAPKGGNLPAPLGAVEVALEVEGRTRSMRFQAGGAFREMPYLPAPGAGLDLRVGGQGGWFVKKVDDLLGIDESVVIRSPAPAWGRLVLGLEGLPSRRLDWRARLIHLASGQVLDPAAGFNLSPGEQEYRLVAGTGTFLAERISAFESGLPMGLVLSQNYPNPFRVQTRINLEWPVLTGPVAAGGRKARLDVHNARGRQVHSQDIGEIRAGRQVITLDGSQWEPGVYTYRLTVTQAGSRSYLQKRLLVSP